MKTDSTKLWQGDKMKDKYYLGNIKISFCVDANNEGEVYEKIEESLPIWMTIDLMTITDEETHEKHLDNHFDENKWEERHYESNH